MATKQQLERHIRVLEKVAGMRAGPDDDIADIVDADLAKLKALLARKVRR